MNGDNEHLPNECRRCNEPWCKGEHKLPPPPRIATLENIQFANNSANLTVIGEESLRNTAKNGMNDSASINETYLIGGHANRTGVYDLNMRLSVRRANAVRNFLIQEGVAAHRLIAKGFSYDKPYDTDHPEDGINRRVEFINSREIQP